LRRNKVYFAGGSQKISFKVLLFFSTLKKHKELCHLRHNRDFLDKLDKAAPALITINCFCFLVCFFHCSGAHADLVTFQQQKGPRYHQKILYSVNDASFSDLSNC